MGGARISLPAVLLLALGGCGDDAAAPPDARPPDAGGSDAGLPRDAGPPDTGPVDAGPAVWESVEETTNDEIIVIERVSYESGGHRVYGQVCRPAPEGRYPVLVFNHGGFEGIGATEWNAGSCAAVARDLRWVVIQSSYRGEDGSDGSVEVCLGEVDDVLEMMRIALAQPYADADRVAMVGASHGGCITLRALQRGAPAHVAAALVPAADWAALHTFWTDNVAMLRGTPEQIAVWEALLDVIETATGGTPEAVPDAYHDRSPSDFGPELAAFPGPVMIVSGADDWLTPPGNQCAMGATIPGVLAFHVTDASGTVVTTAPTGCEAFGIDWKDGPRPAPMWPDGRYLLAYDMAGHEMGSGTPMGSLILGDWAGFVTTRLPPAM